MDFGPPHHQFSGAVPLAGEQSAAFEAGGNNGYHARILQIFARLIVARRSHSRVPEALSLHVLTDCALPVVGCSQRRRRENREAAALGGRGWYHRPKQTAIARGNDPPQA